jgi:hypothetical protein
MELPVTSTKKSGFGHFLALELQTTTAHTQAVVAVEYADAAATNQAVN